MTLFPMYRLNCREANTYNVEQLERIREDEMMVSQESAGKDHEPPAPEDGTEAQDSEMGGLFILTVSVRCG